MKKLFLLVTILVFANSVHGQCNCEKIKRDDGATITQCKALQVSADNSTEIGISFASNGTSNFIAITIRFLKGQVKDVTSKITIRLDDNNMFSLDLVKSGLSYIGNSQVTNAVFKLTTTNISLMKKSNVKTVSFKLTDNLLHTYQVSMNSDVAKKQLNCL
jgi:hypothetical protein